MAMNFEEAKIEAARRWGRDAMAYEGVGHCYLARHDGYDFLGAEGDGETWEEAFADADKKSADRKKTDA